MRGTTNSPAWFSKKPAATQGFSPRSGVRCQANLGINKSTVANLLSPMHCLPVGRCSACLGQNRRIDDLPDLLVFLVEDNPECVCPECGRSFVTVGPELMGFLEHLKVALGQARAH